MTEDAETAIHRAFLSSPIDPNSVDRGELSEYHKGWYDALKTLDSEHYHADDPIEEDTP